MANHTLSVPGLLDGVDDCTACAERLRSQLADLAGIAAADLDPTGRQLVLTYDPAVVSVPSLEAHAHQVGRALQERFRHATLRLEGLDCPECAGTVEQGLARTPGVLRAAASFAAATLYVEYDAEATDLACLARAVSRTGYRAVVPGAATGAVVVHVAEMDCQDEVQAIEKRLGSLPGVASHQVNLVERTLRVQFDPAALGPQAILEAIRGLGMTPVLSERAAQVVAWRRDPAFLSTVVSGVCLGGAFLLDWSAPPSVLSHAFHGLALVAGGWMAARKAVRAVGARRLDMNVLMTVAVLGAIAIGQWDEAATVAFLFALAQVLETYTLDRARQAVRRLLAVVPAEATVRRDGHEVRLPVAAVSPGDVVLVRPGERVALDGVVRAGSSSVNQAPITGESMPVEKAAGAQVFGGSVNGEGALEVEVTHRAQDTMVARIIALLEQAQAQKAPTQTFVERFAAVYTPAVIAAAVAIASLPPLLLGQPAWPWIYRALVLLVIACPCALVISTPVAVVCGLTRAARAGILIKGGRFLEALGNLKAMAFDKTGTLTRGQPAVTHVRSLDGADARRVLELAAAVEARSEHPLGAAILRAAREQGITLPAATGFRAVAGRGARAELDGGVYHVGSHRYIEDLGACSESLEAILGELEDRGQTPVVLSDGTRPLGVVAVADEIRPGAAESLAALHQLGVRPLVVLTGDTPRTGEAVGRQAGADEVRAALLPEDKVAAVQDLVRRHGVVGMVGDGINDAPALATATVGFAMGEAGTDAAVETADVALVRDDLGQIPVAVRLGRRTLRIIRTNVALALATKAAFVTLAVLGYATLWMAVAADMGTSLAVIANGMRLLGNGAGGPAPGSAPAAAAAAVGAPALACCSGCCHDEHA
ncbi:MAG: heavy metal translocating P-type ATPase [Candidatus Latescibacterota bacterium]